MLQAKSALPPICSLTRPPTAIKAAVPPFGV